MNISDARVETRRFEMKVNKEIKPRSEYISRSPTVP